MEEQELHIYSEQVKDVLTSPPKAIHRWGNTILFFFFVLILILSYVIKYSDIVTGQAVLTTTIPPQKEYARTTGKLTRVFVKNNQKVKENTHLALIENTANYEDVMQLKSIVDTIHVNAENFQFPMTQLPVLFLGEIETAFSVFENNYIQYILNKTANSYQFEQANNQYTLAQLKLRLKASEEKRKINEEELLFKKKDIDRLQGLLDKGVISEQNFEQKKLAYLEAKRSFNDVNITISQIKERISNSSTTKKKADIANVRKEINLLKATLQSFNQLKKVIKDWELRYLFKSNINGTVSFMNVWSKNQTVNTNDLVFTIVPETVSTYICKVQVPVTNARKLKIGQSVNIKLSSYPDHEFGVLKGRVNKIALIPTEKGMYLLDVILPNGLQTTYNKSLKFTQEMQGVAEVITEDLRLVERIFYRFKKIINKS
ncbi:HlyD family efflux transporter periplasmic adaptor subunit [Tenacibaculum sp. 190524A02b]|uniref:HlyD family secretion protein n=1 Tax=Tenacibaculum vairaonense TaxID=3137860 RepID=UPI0031FAF819